MQNRVRLKQGLKESDVDYITQVLKCILKSRYRERMELFFRSF
jgi:hypothetical protein